MIYDEITQQLDPPIAEVLKDVYVLFADDDENTLNLLRYYANLFEWKGVFVKSATEILEAINKNCLEETKPFDAVVADVNYFQTDANITGITAAREIRKVRPDVPIVFVSAYSNSIIREEVRRVNAEFVAKPADLPQLFNMLAVMIYWHKLSSAIGYIGQEKVIPIILNSARSKANER